MGGLARRASKIDTFRRPDQGLIILDTGDSLVESGAARNLPTENLQPVAGTMLRALGHMGADALVPGENDLAAGLRWLAKEAGHAEVPLLAANLKAARGKNPFKARRLIKAGQVKVGLFGLVDLTGEPAETVDMLKKAGVKQKPALAAAKAQIKALHKQGAELIVMLAHMPHETLKKLLGQLKGVHLVVQGHQGMHLREPLRVGETYVVEAGRRGRELGHVVVALGPAWKARGPMAMADDTERYAMYQRINMQVGVLKNLLSTVDPGQPPPDTAVELNKRIQGIMKDYQKAQEREEPHTLAVTMHPLDDKVPDHPAVSALLKRQPAAADPPSDAPPVKLHVAQPVPLAPEELRRIEQEVKRQKVREAVPMPAPR